MKNVCNFDLTYDIFLQMQKYLYQVSFLFFLFLNYIKQGHVWYIE